MASSVTNNLEMRRHHTTLPKNIPLFMIIEGIVNPQVSSLMCRVRHTNTLVIADAAFPFWPQIETVDISLVKGVPTIIQLLDALLPNWKCGEIFMAQEFNECNDRKTQAAFKRACHGVRRIFEPHID